MREKLALTGDGLSESMREASLGRRELEQASLTIMQVLPHSCACLHSALVLCPESGHVRTHPAAYLSTLRVPCAPSAILAER